MRGRIDLAFQRHERDAREIAYTRLIDEPLIVLMRAAINAEDISGQRLVDVPRDKSPAFRTVTDA